MVKEVKFVSRFDTEVPYSIPNMQPVPKIEAEEGMLPGQLDIAWVEESRKNDVHWSRGLKWYDRLHAHMTMASARRHRMCTRPFEPKDELDFVLESIYDPLRDAFSEKQDTYLQIETSLGEDMNIAISERRNAANVEYHPTSEAVRTKPDLRKPQYTPPSVEQKQTWRSLRNRMVIVPDKAVPREHPIKYADPGNQRRENIYNVKLGIAADHSPQTNPGYSRTPSGAFYAI